MSADAASTAPPRRFRWLQFSLRTLLLGMVAAALVFAWFRQRIEREQRIDEAVRLLEMSPKPDEDPFDPIALVRAVNCLHSLGKDDAIAALRRFVARRGKGGSQHDAAVGLFLVIPLSFEPVDPEDGPSNCAICDEMGECNLSLNGWPQIHVILKDDLPLRARFTGAYSTGCEDWLEVIQWAEQRGRLRGSPLRPPDDPVTVAEKISRRWEDCENLKDSFQDQATRTIAHLIEPFKIPDRPDEETVPFFGLSGWQLQPETEPCWLHLKAECRRLGIRWSEAKQQYVATKGAK
jgi:hypothetical protein